MLARFFILAIFLLAPLAAAPPKVIVTLAPTKCLVEKIAGKEVVVMQFVPAGASPHSFEPTAKQLLDAAEGALWFRIGEGFEGRTLDVFKGKTTIVNLREGLPLLTAPCCQCHPKDIYDPHIWLSIPLLKLQSKKIAEALCNLLPDSKALFEANLELLLAELTTLDQELHQRLDHHPQKYILVTHPAFGYFCREYGLTQLSIEVDGKEPTPKQMTALLEKARKEKIDRLICEPQHNAKGGMRMAEELRIPVIWLDPYKENVIENLKTIANALTMP